MSRFDGMFSLTWLMYLAYANVEFFTVMPWAVDTVALSTGPIAAQKFANELLLMAGSQFVLCHPPSGDYASESEVAPSRFYDQEARPGAASAADRSRYERTRVADEPEPESESEDRRRRAHSPRGGTRSRGRTSGSGGRRRP